MRTNMRILAVGLGLTLMASVLLAQDKAGKSRRGRPRDGGRREGKLKVGDMAPNFTLPSLDGKRKVTLRAFRGKRPVALIFGSYT